MTFYKNTVTPHALCIEVKHRLWHETSKEEYKETAVVMFLRRTAGSTRSNRKSNTDIRVDLQIRNVVERIQEYRGNE